MFSKTTYKLAMQVPRGGKCKSFIFTIATMLRVVSKSKASADTDL